jgi:4-hydroxy-tetrahydrodipicolinate synthase
VKENAPKYGRTPGKDIVVMPGTGSNSTAEAIDLTKFAEKKGADAVLLICPYYNKPTQEGLKLHFKMIADETSVPLVPYNIPSRTGRNMEAKTTIEIAKFENVVGIKEASGNLAQMMEIIQKTDDDFAVMSGDDQLTLPLMALGGKGVVSVAANIVPKMMVEFTEALLNNNFQKGKQLHYKLLDLFNVQFIETNPGPIKYMASLMGLPAGNLRPPMTLPQQHNEGKIKEVMKALSLI